jgi:hypothetical protein
MIIASCACFITGIAKWPGLITSLGLKYSSLPFGAISSLHDWSGIGIGILAALHVILHRKWIAAMTSKALNGQGGEK